MPSLPHSLPSYLRSWIPWLWLAGFFFLAFNGATVAPPHNAGLFVLAVSGWLYFLVFSPEQLRQLLSEHRGITVAALALAVAILASEAIGAWRGIAPPHPLPPQAALLLCLLPLALFLMDDRYLRAVVALFAAVCAWHFVALPIEAIWGLKLSWHPVYLLPRVAGPLNYQAAGLAWQAYYFAGLFLPLFYLAWGPIYEKRVFGELEVSRRLMLALALLWLVTAACIQSRSAFAGALCAAVLAIIAASGANRSKAWLAAGLLAVLAAAVYWHMFAENKSGAELRVAYFKLYMNASLEWPWIATGRSFYLDPDLRMMVPGMTPLQHSHNDISQIFYSWGLPTLLSYLVFWVSLLKLVLSRFMTRGEYWPACALVVLFPSMVTDLGFQHYEKAAFVVIFTAFCLALRPREPAGVKP